MRERGQNGDLQVHAIAGTYVVLLGMNVRSSSRMLNGLLGFALRKTNLGTGKRSWVPGFKTFRSTADGHKPGTLLSSRSSPIQGFLWGDYLAEADHGYRYEVFPAYGRPERLLLGDPAVVEVATEPEASAVHAVHFNRGAGASQAYTRRFGNRTPDEVGPRAYTWLSRGLEEAMLRFIASAEGTGWGLRAAFYECSHAGVLTALAEANGRGVDVRLVYDKKEGSGKPGRQNEAAIRRAGLEDIATQRVKNPSYISHNKFMVLLRRGKPVAVWTGSTNVTTGGIFGHSNVGHIIRDRDVADAYLAYWNALAGDPAASALRQWNDDNSPVPPLRSREDMSVIFSPRSSLEALEHYAALMDGAKSGVFLTAAFGVNKLLRKVLARDRSYLRYLLLEREDKDSATDPDIAIYKRDRENLIAVGSHLRQNVLERWVQRRFRREELTGLNKHVKYIHTKYMLIDPLGASPTVITGSANFSDASTRNNDENMVIIRNDPRVADVYLGEFMRTYNHYRFRWIAEKRKRGGARHLPRQLFLAEENSWLDAYYDPKSIKMKERKLFG